MTGHRMSFEVARAIGAEVPVSEVNLEMIGLEYLHDLRTHTAVQRHCSSQLQATSLWRD